MQLNNVCITYLTANENSFKYHWWATRNFYTQHYRSADSSYQAVVLESENQLKKYQSEDMSVKFLPFICFCLERRIKLF